MKRIELAEGLYSSVLGFGCAPILGSVDGKTAARAVDCALDNGINHFDLARSYGYGDAERFMGKIARGRRDRLVLASKFGIKANWKARLLGPVKPAVRMLKGLRGSNIPAPAAASAVTSNWSGADRFHDRIPLTGQEMRKSLEETLSALGTDYLDYFFVHEPTATLAYLDELSETALRLKQEGKIRAFGLAYNRLQQDLHASYLGRFDLLQFDNAPGSAGYEATTRERAGKPNIFFSPLRGGRPDMSPAEKLVALNQDYPRSVILCSMFKEEHIRMNARLFQ